MAYQSSFPSAAMDLQELIDEIVDYLYDSPSALKACSLIARKFYSRTRIHLFREADCDNPESARVFDIVRDSPELLQYIKRVQFRCLNFFLPKHQITTSEFLHSLPSPTTLSLWNDSIHGYYSEEGCQWVDILPSFVSSAPYFAITRLEVKGPRWNTFLEFHHTVLSLPNVTELYISGLTEQNTNDDPVVPAPPAPCIRKMLVNIECGTILRFWEGLRSYRSVYLQNLDEFHAINIPPNELGAAVQTANFAFNGLKVMEINDLPFDIWGFTRLSFDISPLRLNPNTELRVSVDLNDDILQLVRWWIKCFQAVEKESTVMELLTIKLDGRRHFVTPERLEPLKNPLEELSELLSQLVRNVDLVLQLQDDDANSGLCTDCLRGAIIDACKALKEQVNLRIFDMTEYTFHVPVFPFPATTRRIF
ncbi:hypothetical protein F5146DRAFT_1081951 [Armillaria mellea]|nr:hypothetical protein F5146DRAFT_1081951 [Armillaria mellea]